MKTITTLALSHVNGGTKSSDLTTALTSIQSSIKDVATSKNSGGLDSTTMLMLAMTMGQKNNGPTVVAGAPAAAPVVAGGPIVNISTRVRRGW